MSLHAVDTASKVSANDAKKLSAAGIKAIGRYYSDPNNKWKIITRKEAEHISAAEIEIWTVYQNSHRHDADFSASIGTAEAKEALAYAQNTIGQPKGSAIYFSADYDASEEAVKGPIAAHFQAIRAVFEAAGNPYRIGIYGSGRTCSHLLNAGLADLAWLSMSTGHAGHSAFYASKRWSIAQGKAGRVADVGIDTNETQGADFGQFRLDAAVRPAVAAADAVPTSAGAPAPVLASGMAGSEGNVVPRYPGRIIKRGEFDSETVAAIQQRLTEIGITKLVVDRDFGEATEDAVSLFQARHTDPLGRELEVDGEIGPNTWAALFGAEALSESLPLPAGASARDLVVQIAASQVGVREEPRYSNRGPQVDEYIRAAGLNPRADSYAWCICFIQWVFKEAARTDASGLSTLPRTAGVHALWKLRTNGATNVVAARQAEPALIKPGMVFLFDTGGGKGHGGIVESVAGDRLVTIEGNTNNGGSRDGYGVFRRKTRLVKMPRLLGYIDFIK
ncbi:glycoside hydrolase domain-containing protein [Methylobacterium aquaticum]|uniref:glycoside hydrolase domain-containing protein n=1 Tax=Methylobacterium aquaticum TaxID=270351 RepID=UPI0019348D1C|nr:glycoside hydrolase domain-containing protein [Methylobacterium aquaticum]QRE73641.1 DUF1906 domain-containing protein [Methylobacterium aquaticum]